MLCAMKFITICMKTKEIRKCMRDHMEKILYEVTLMVMVVTPKELSHFHNVRSIIV